MRQGKEFCESDGRYSRAEESAQHWFGRCKTCHTSRQSCLLFFVIFLRWFLDKTNSPRSSLRVKQIVIECHARLVYFARKLNYACQKRSLQSSQALLPPRPKAATRRFSPQRRREHTAESHCQGFWSDRFQTWLIVIAHYFQTVAHRILAQEHGGNTSNTKTIVYKMPARSPETRYSDCALSLKHRRTDTSNSGLAWPAGSLPGPSETKTLPSVVYSVLDAE